MTDSNTANHPEPASYDTRIPSDETPVACPYCDRPLENEELLVLHEGLDHWERLDDERRETFRETYENESDDLRTFRLKMLGLLVVLYFTFLFIYSIETQDAYRMIDSGLFLVVGGIFSYSDR